METNIAIKYCLYARKSSEQDERQAMSIDSQLKEMIAMAEREGLEIVEVKQESHSAKQSGQRPVFLQLIEDLRADKFNGILTWAPDRLSRNAGDLGSLVDLMDSTKLAQIRTFSQSFSNNPNEKFLLMILCSQAKLENDNRGINVKRGIRAKCEMGWRPGVAPLGYMNRAFGGVKDIIVDPERAPLVQAMFERAALGWSGRRLKYWLDKNGFTTRGGGKITLSQIFIMLNNTFYFGEFKYGKDTYIGSHKPLISKELYLRVQSTRNPIKKTKWGSKQFAFKGLLHCGGCGSEITAQEKFKRLKNGELNRHIYYHCTRQVNYVCRERYYMKEDALIKALEEFMVTLKHSKLGLSPELRSRIAIYDRMSESALGQNGHSKRNDLNEFQSYMNYVLNFGKNEEKAFFINGLNLELVLRDKKVGLTNMIP